MALRARLISRAGIVLATVVAVVLLALVASPLVGEQQIQRLDGPVQIEVIRDGQVVETRTMTLPAQFVHEGLPSDARVRARWTVDLSEVEPSGWGVWFERPLYAARLYWDGRLVDELGEVDGTARSEGSLFASAAVNASGKHEIMLDLRGDYGKGGVIGRMVHGPLPQVWRLAARVEAEKVALVLLLASLSVLHLLLAGRRSQRWTYTFFGLFCLTLALYVFLRTDMANQLFPELAVPLRARRMLTAWLGPMGLGLAATFEHHRPKPWIIALIAAAGTLSMSAWILPMDWVAVLEILFDLMLVASVGAFAVLSIRMAWRGVPGARLLALSAMIPLTWGALSEILVTQGLVGGGSHLMPTIATLAIGLTAALMLRDAVNSERLDRLVRSNIDAMICVDREGHILDTNPAADALFGSRARGANLLQWIVSDDQVLARAHLSDSPHRPERAELRVRGQDRVLESVAAELDDRNLLLILRDVTRRRQLDHGLLQAARMETLAVLVGGLAHDFNNMLGTLLAHVGFLQATSASGSKLRMRLDRMETTIERASQLTRGLASLTRGTTASLEPTELHQVVAAAVEAVRSTWPERASLWVDVPESLPAIAGAASDLEQALINLLVNARDAAGHTGSVWVTARAFTTHQGAHGVLCAIEDDGPGVPVNLREQIFTPFFSTREQREGVGLGLAVAAQVIREHQGKIWVDDRSGGGARFCIALRQAEGMLDQPEAQVSGERLVLVDDEAALRETWAVALRKRGYEVVTFGDGSQAAEHLSAHRPDALLTDVLLPGLNGLQLASLCRALHADVPILIISGYIPEDTLDPHPLTTRLDKPIRTQRLVAAVGQILNREPYDASDPDSGPTRMPSLEDVTWESVQWGTPARPPRRGARSPSPTAAQARPERTHTDEP